MIWSVIIGFFIYLVLVSVLCASVTYYEKKEGLQRGGKNKRKE